MTQQCDPRGLLQAARRQGAAAARRRGEEPLRGRLAGRHQRHARDDRLQFEGGRLLSDHRRPRADPDARDPGRARGARSAPSRRATIGKCTRASARKAGEYGGRWFDPSSRRTTTPSASPSGCGARPTPAAIVAACRGKKGVATEETKPSTQLSPLLFDLTSLQREANGRFGFPARMTLSLAQALYERHKVLTYPRTDSRALPEDYLPTVKDTLKALGEAKAFSTFARQILKQGWAKPNKRIFDNTKISDHFAIIPTLQTPKHLNEAEQKLYDLVVRRFLAVFYPAAEYLQTTRITRVDAASFQDRRPRAAKPGLARGVRPRDRRRGADPGGDRARTRKCRCWKWASRRRRPSRHRATRKRRCSRRWKARASWSKTTSCARRWRPKAWARRRPGRRPSRG